MKKKLKIGLAILLTVSFAGCTKEFSELNTNPNTSAKVLPQNLLERALIETVSNNMERSRVITNELMQVTVNTLVEVDRIFRYDIRRNISDAPWNTWYTQLTNFKDMYNLAAENTADANSKAYMGVSLILQAWVHSMLTDTYGSTPFTESNKGKEGVYTPAFDDQKTIYLGMFKMLEEANTLLNGAKNISVGHDPIYAGDATKWRKFGNSLYLRLLLRVAHKEEIADIVIPKLKEIATPNNGSYPIMISNDDSAILRWTGISPRVSPWVTMREQSWNYPKMCSFFVERLDKTNDPCIGEWATKIDGIYEGIPSGYIFGATPEGRSLLPRSLISSPMMGNILNYAELQFILAEITLKGWETTQTVAHYYEQGVNSRISYWGKTTGSYLTSPTIAWNENETVEQKMEKIFWQKYLALFMTDMQPWIEYRRTGYPKLTMGQGLLNDGIMPTRLFYPLTVQATNLQNYNDVLSKQGEDNLKTLMWWQKP
ncbi:MAG: SusD/RagB family nutrient-binding outer membrane lipoprotein [Sphingobacterium hotanense]